MENRNLQRQAKEQQRKKEICYQCQKAKDRAGRRKRYPRKIPFSNKRSPESSSC